MVCGCCCMERVQGGRENHVQQTKRKLVSCDTDPKTLREIADAASALFEVLQHRDPAAAMAAVLGNASVSVIVASHQLVPGDNVSLLDAVKLKRPDVWRVFL